MITGLVPPCNTVADIGTDHGFVPVFLVREGIAKRAIAADIGEGPLERAREHVAERGLSDRIECRLGDGLQVLSPGEADVLIIAGMGGLLMISILEAGLSVAERAEKLILSPHTDIPKVREWLFLHRFCIENEQMTEEDGKFYTALVCRPKTAKFEVTGENGGDGGKRAPEGTAGETNGTDGSETLSADEIRFGPCLLRERPAVFLRCLRREERNLHEIISGMDREIETEAGGMERASGNPETEREKGASEASETVKHKKRATRRERLESARSARLKELLKIREILGESEPV